MEKEASAPAASQVSDEPGESQGRDLEAKWGKDIVDARYTIVPNILLEKQRAIGRDQTQQRRGRVMPPLPLISGRQCITALTKLGYREVRQRGSHVRLACRLLD